MAVGRHCTDVGSRAVRHPAGEAVGGAHGRRCRQRWRWGRRNKEDRLCRFGRGSGYRERSCGWRERRNQRCEDGQKVAKHPGRLPGGVGSCNAVLQGDPVPPRAFEPSDRWVLLRSRQGGGWAAIDAGTARTQRLPVDRPASTLGQAPAGPSGFTASSANCHAAVDGLGQVGGVTDSTGTSSAAFGSAPTSSSPARTIHRAVNAVQTHS